MVPDFDIAICGAGPVGLALAALLVQRGFAASRLVIIDAKSRQAAIDDPRSLALSYGSAQILQQAAAWPLAHSLACAATAVPNTAVTPIRQVHISRQGQFGRTLLDCADYHLPALGYVVRYGALVSRLTNVLTPAAITLLCPAKITQITCISQSAYENCISLTLSTGQILTAGWVIQAEGSRLDADQPENSTTQTHDYAQTALVAQVCVSAPVAYRAFERFASEGPIALLPQNNDYALVWCVAPVTAARLINLSDIKFLHELQQAFGERLGRFISATPRHSYPLTLQYQKMSPSPPASSAQNRLLAIGNAAQTLHPVAGQGLNLGLRDAALLARLLAQETSSSAFTQFIQQRHTDRALAVRLTDTLARLFTGAPHTPKQTLLGLALSALDFAAPAKKSLAEQMIFGWRA